jgi:predicted AAA+ superfamily ATPase
MIKRKIKKEIVAHLNKKEISLIAGARQIGKTTLLQEIMNDLITANEKVLFLNLDIESHFVYFKTQDTLLNKIRLELGESGFVFIDEIQRLENAGLFLKGIYDSNLAYKFIVTGSGSLELKENISESLAGRKRVFEMMPVSFTEFVNHKTGYRYEDRLSQFFDIEKEKTNSLLIEYLNFGGFPRVITENLLPEKAKIMDEIVKSYIEKDLVYLLKIDRPELFSLLIKILSLLCGKMINFSELAKQTNLSVPTIKKYLWYAEKTFCIYWVTPYFSNALKEITKSATCYFNDLGFRNYPIGQMGNLQINQQMGFVFQNFIFLILKEYTRWKNCSINYWRSTDKAEVDFVLNFTTSVIPVEVKYGTIKKPTVSRSFRSFIEKYAPAEAWIINLDFESEMTINSTKVIFKPFYKLLNESGY